MGPYFGMDVDSMAAMLFATPSAPFHAAADNFGSVFSQLVATNGDVAAANNVIVAWPESIGSLAQLAYAGNVVNSQASLADWAVFSGTMSGALQVSGTALDVAQAVMPVLQSSYNLAMTLSSIPLIGGLFVPVAEGIRDASAGMMEAVDTVIQAPTLVQPPAQGWQGPGVSDPGAPIPAPPAAAASSLDPTSLGNAANSLGEFAETGSGMAQQLMGMAQEQGLEQGLQQGTTKIPTGMPTSGVVQLPTQPTVPNAPVTVPVLAGGAAPAPPSFTDPSFAPPASSAPDMGAAGTVLSPSLGFGGVPTMPTRPNEVSLTGSGAGVGAAEGSDTEPELAASTPQSAPAAVRPTTPLPPPMAGAMGAGGSSGDVKPGVARKRETDAAERKNRLRRNGVQAELQGRAARESRPFGVRQSRRRKTAAENNGRVDILDKELFATDISTPDADRG